MTEMVFEARVRATGLQPPREDLPKLKVLVEDMDRAAALVRAPQSYAEEPLSVLQLKPAQVCPATDCSSNNAG
jgi:hypothetical protein